MEAYRRALLDEEVNNSAATKLSQWKNVNQPMDPRNWFEKLLGLNPPGKVTKGVRKLREREASEGKQVVLTKVGEESRISESTKEAHQDDEVGYFAGAGGRRLDDIQSVDEHMANIRSNKQFTQISRNSSWMNCNGFDLRMFCGFRIINWISAIIWKGNKPSLMNSFSLLTASLEMA